VRIVVVEDQTFIRGSIVHVCNKDASCQIVGEASSGEEALRLTFREAPDLVLLDLGIEGLDGFGVISALRQARSTAKILLLTSATGHYTYWRVQRARVEGLVHKTNNCIDDLLKAIKAVGEGRSYFAPHFQQLTQQRMDDKHSFDKVLSEVEIDVLARIARAMSDDEIAADLTHAGHPIAVGTVQKHRNALFTKMTRSGEERLATPKLIKLAIDLGFTELTPSPMRDRLAV
jgi:DNA-binding NarL/FixJ family response regulator